MSQLDETEESLGTQKTVILVRIAHLPVCGDQTGHWVENLWGFAGNGHRLVRKVAHFDPCRSESLYAFFGWGLGVADVACYFCCGGRGGLGKLRRGGGEGLWDLSRGVVGGFKG